MEIIELVKSLGAGAALKTFTPGIESVWIVAGPRLHTLSTSPLAQLQTFSHGISVTEENGGWRVEFEFSKFRKTRIISNTELETLLRTWVPEPDNAIFKKFEQS